MINPAIPDKRYALASLASIYPEAFAMTVFPNSRSGLALHRLEIGRVMSLRNWEDPWLESIAHGTAEEATRAREIIRRAEPQ